MTSTAPGDVFIIGGIHVPGLIQAIFPLTLHDHAIQDLLVNRSKIVVYPVWHGHTGMVSRAFDG